MQPPDTISRGNLQRAHLASSTLVFTPARRGAEQQQLPPVPAGMRRIPGSRANEAEDTIAVVCASVSLVFPSFIYSQESGNAGDEQRRAQIRSGGQLHPPCRLPSGATLPLAPPKRRQARIPQRGEGLCFPGLPQLRNARNERPSVSWQMTCQIFPRPAVRQPGRPDRGNSAEF